MLFKFISQRKPIVLLMASVVMGMVSTKEETNPSWRQMAEPGLILEPQLKLRSIEPVACEETTCRTGDWFKTCSAGKVCNSGGCYDCPPGSHYCPRDEGFYFNACPNDKQCDSTGCITGADQESYLAAKQMCCTGAADVIELPNPCETNNGDCSDTCENNNGVAECSCTEGILKADGKTCTGYWRSVNNRKPKRVLSYSGSDHQCNIAHQQCYWTDFLVAKEECYKWDACKLLWETKEFGNLGTPVYWARGARGSEYEGVGYRVGSVLWEFMPGPCTTEEQCKWYSFRRTHQNCINGKCE